MSGCKLNPVGLGLSLGVIWGVSIFIMGLLAYHFSYGKPFVEMMSAIYLGFAPSVMGSVIGGVIGFVDAFIGGFLIAWLYNCFNCCPSCCKTEEK